MQRRAVSETISSAWYWNGVDLELVQRADKAGGRETGDFSGFPLRHWAGFISHATCHLTAVARSISRTKPFGSWRRAERISRGKWMEPCSMSITTSRFIITQSSMRPYICIALMQVFRIKVTFFLNAERILLSPRKALGPLAGRTPG